MKVKQGHQMFADRLVQELMLEADRMGYNLDDLAEALGSSRRTVENYKYGSTPTVAGFFGIIRTVKPVEVMCRLAAISDGYFLKPTVKGSRVETELTKHTSVIMKEVADVLKAIAVSLADGQIRNNEKSFICREADEAIEALLLLKLKVES
ncbi:MAG: hypothetical protein JXB42_12750 [Deltaproteobacteria bacterium]|nr:hypothetical protein [Deltaproteobacteria bacterium]